MAKLKMNNSELTFKVAFQNFINYQRLKNVKDDTIKNYNLNYRIFTEFFNEDSFCKDINEEVYLDYKKYLMETRKNENTINTYLRHIKAVFNYMMKKGYIEKFEMTLLQVDENIKDVYTEEEIEKLLKKPNMEKCNFSEYRTWVIVNYILATGNRINTIRNILIKDLDFENEEIFLRVTKGRRQYKIPMSHSLKIILKEYLEIRGGEKEDYLFCTEDIQQLSQGGMIKAFARYAIRRGVDKTSEHLLRHTFAKYYYLYDGDVMALNYILGHKDLGMTKHYLNLLCKDIQVKNSSSNPLEHFTKRKIKMR